MLCSDTTESYPYPFSVWFMLWEQGSWHAVAVPIQQQGDGDELWPQGHSLSLPGGKQQDTKRMNKGILYGGVTREFYHDSL